MSTQMKDILATLELLTKEKIEPETILEEGEIEEVLTISEDGELTEAKPGSMGTAFGKNQWRVEEEGGSWQVYIWSEPNNDWIAQGQPHKTQAEAEKDAKSFFESAEKKIVEDWGSSDWTVAMEAMWDSLLKQHNGKITPETMEQAAEEVIMVHGEQMGYDEGSLDEGVSQVVSMFLNRQDGIKQKGMIGLANDTRRYAGKTKYM